MLKEKARAGYRSKLTNLTQEEYDTLTALLFHRFCQYKWPVVKYVLSYSPVTVKREFDISLCEDELKKQLPGVTVAWPKINELDKSMEAHEIRNEKFFKKNRFNILEPLDGAIVAPEQLELVFVPSLGFDKNGYRIGHGMGYYDRYLSRCSKQAIKVGFSFFEPFPALKDIHRFDVPLNLCITPQQIYEF